MQERWDAGQKGYRTAVMHEIRDLGYVGCSAWDTEPTFPVA